MAYLEDHKAKFDNLRVSLDLRNRDQLRRRANGGNSIIFTYPPDEEYLYLKKLEERSQESGFRLIDVAQLFVEFIELDGWADFEAYYNDFRDTPHLIYKSDDESTDLMDLLIRKIKEADQQGKIPVLIRTGALFGTGIENVNIMEDKVVMALTHPLVIFYPSKIENENLYFLNFKTASKYRCTVIE
jgi:hypothetical protein